MTYRESDGENIDDLKRHVQILKEANGNLEERMERMQTGRIRKLVVEGSVVLAVAIGLIAGGVGIRNCHQKEELAEAEEKKAVVAHNLETEKKVFSGAISWIKKYNNNLGYPWCRFEESKGDDGRINIDGVVSCYVRLEDVSDIMWIDCSPKLAKCFRNSPEKPNVPQ